MDLTPLFIGIDVSKLTFDVCIQSSNGTSSHLKLANSLQGINEFVSHISKLSNSSTIVMESTGSYHLLLALMLTENNLKVCVINPIIMQRFAKGFIRNQKSDRVDCIKLAQIAQMFGNELTVFDSSRTEIAIRKKVSLLTSLSKQLQTFNTMNRNLIECWDSLDLPNSEGIESIHDVIASLKKTIRQLEKEVTEYYSKSELHQRISKIAGISAKSTSKLLGTLEGKEFLKAKHLVAFAGLDVNNSFSGTSIRRTGKLSKRGSRHLRNILFHVAWGLKTHNPIFKAMYERLRSIGRHYYEALLIVGRKFLRIVFAMIKSKVEFNPNLLLTV